MTEPQWTFQRFQDLGPERVHALFKARVDVFVVEQQCPYPEVDDDDLRSIHVIGTHHHELVAYARIIPARAAEDLPHVGRVLVTASHRGRGIAHRLMHAVRDQLRRMYGSARSALAAQQHLQGFYAAHGYVPVGDVYDLDGIPHVDMVRSDP
ncbi:MAG: GNAT family N-acetyltransferase [Flavobacteriales bacterium]